ncbi:MAG: IS3 family transposase [Gordonia sp. (in: high G+C Gram-positive bacteria)]
MPRRFSVEFKNSVALEVIEHCRPVAQVAKENSVSEQSVSRWVKSYREEHPELTERLDESERDELLRLRRQVKRLETEVEFLGKSYGLLRPEISTVERFEAISAEEGNYSVSLMCRVLGVSRSGFYEWKGRVESERSRRRRELGDLIEKFFEASEQTYGYRRIHADLVFDGYSVDDDTVRSIMRERGLWPCQPGPKRPVTTVAADAAGLPDLVRRDFTAADVGVKLVGDITYIRTWEGWLFLATVLDCHSKKVVGYAMSDRMTADLVCRALDKAAQNIPFRPGETIFHSDRGSQYMSEEFARCARRHGVRRSVGRTGVCYDNAWAESFNGTLKNECVNRKSYATRDRARKDVTRYIELRYNSRRRHSVLGYLTPNDVESEWFNRRHAG